MVRARALVLVALAGVATACQKDTIDVHKQGADYNRHGLLAAIDRFNAAGRTPEAFGKFAADELAVALACSRYAAERMLVLAHDLAARLPLTAAALNDGLTVY